VRAEWGRVLSALIARLRDIQLSEDVLQEALISALDSWKDSPPDNPRAWLYKVAYRRAIDRLRRSKTFERKQQDLKILQDLEKDSSEPEDTEMVPDEQLSLIFTCCHPAIAEPAQVALTLKTLGGLTTEEIARAYLVPEPTMAQRIVRAKKKIKTAGIPYRIPDLDQWPDRLQAVLAVIYLIFNEGYAATSGQSLIRRDLCDEAIRLARLIAGLIPDEPEAKGLLALMSFTNARRDARTNEKGGFVALEHQDRTLWDRKQIDEAEEYLTNAAAQGKPGPYQLQAAISGCHCRGRSYPETDWPQIVELYERLFDLQPTAVIALNRAVALSFADGPKAGLAALTILELEEKLGRYQPFHAAKADMLRRAGDQPGARESYKEAIRLSDNEVESQFLKDRLAEIS